MKLITNQPIYKKVAILACWLWAGMAFSAPLSSALTLSFSYLACIFSVASIALECNWTLLRRVIKNPMILFLIGSWLWITLAMSWSIGETPAVFDAWYRYRKFLYVLLIVVVFIQAKMNPLYLVMSFVLSLIILGVASLNLWLETGLIYPWFQKYVQVGSPSMPAIGRNYLVFGVFLVCGALMCTILWEKSGSLAKNSALILFGSVFLFIPLFLLPGRTPIVLFLLSIIPYILWLLFKRNFITLVLTVSGFILLVFMIYQGNPHIRDRVQAATKEAVEINPKTSVGFRLHMFSVSYEIFKQNPIFGSGTGAYAASCEKLYDDKDIFNGTPLRHGHSEFMTLLADYGLTGFLLAMGVIGSTISMVLFSRLPDFKKVALLSLLIVVLFDGVPNPTIWDIAAGHYFVYILALIYLLTSQTCHTPELTKFDK